MLRRIAATITLIIALSPTAFLFQNCGNGFEAGMEGMSSIALAGPNISISQAPGQLINVRTATVQFSVSAMSTSTLVRTSCSLDNAVLADCADRYDMNALQDGDHALRIEAEDSRGNVSERVVRFQVDATIPVVAVNSGPAAVSGLTEASVAFTATDNLSGIALIECSYNDGAFATCASPRNFTGLTQANYSLKVRARDMAGNMSAEVVHSWRVDMTAPVITIATGPAAITNSRSATFTFSGTDDGIAITSFQCSIDNGAYTSCVSPASFNVTAEGNHTLGVRGTDSAGNASTAVTRMWMVDSVVPSVSFIATPPSLTAQTSYTFQFSGSDAQGGSGIARYECSLNNVAFSTCTSPYPVANLSSALHNFRVRSVDNAANISNIASYSWTVDNLPPVISIASGPTNPTISASATFTYTISDPGAGLDYAICAVDNPAPQPNCSSPQSYSSLAVGSHTFYIRAVDKLGNLSQISTYTWNITQGRPVFVTPLPPNSGGIANTPLTLSVVASGENLTYQWYRLGSAIAGATGSSYVVQPFTVGLVEYYSVTVTNAYGSISSQTNVKFHAAPVISEYYTINDVDLNVGQTYNLTPSVSGTTPTYSWTKDGVNLGITTATLPLTNVQLSQAGVYRVTASNPAGTATQDFKVTVTAPTLNLATVGTFATESMDADARIVGNRAYLKTTKSVWILERQANGSFVHRSTILPPNPQIEAISKVTAIEAVGLRLYVFFTFHIYVYDTTNAASPTLLGTNFQALYNTVGATTVWNAKMIGNYMYVAHRQYYNSQSSGRVSLLSFNGATPTYVATLNSGSTDFSLPSCYDDFELVGNRLGCVWSSFGAWNVTNPAAPTPLFKVGMPGAGASTINHLYHMDSLGQTLNIKDISNPASHSLVQSREITYRGVNEIRVIGNRMFIGDSRLNYAHGSSGTGGNSTFLSVYDISNPTVPRFVQHFSIPVARLYTSPGNPNEFLVFNQGSFTHYQFK